MGKSKTSFKVGYTPWNKETKGIMKAWNIGLTKEADVRVRRNAELTKLGISDEEKIRRSNRMKGMNNPVFKVGSYFAKPEFKERLKNIDKSYMKTKEYRLKVSEGRKGIKLKTPRSNEYRKKQSVSQKKSWSNPIIREKRWASFSKKPTSIEEYFNEIIEEFNLSYKYVGNRKFWIEKINPDFININGIKICIEIFGDYWHNKPNSKELDEKKGGILQKNGWKRIIIWEKDLKIKPKLELVKLIQNIENIFILNQKR